MIARAKIKLARSPTYSGIESDAQLRIVQPGVCLAVVCDKHLRHGFIETDEMSDLAFGLRTADAEMSGEYRVRFRSADRDPSFIYDPRILFLYFREHTSVVADRSVAAKPKLFLIIRRARARAHNAPIVAVAVDIAYRISAVIVLFHLRAYIFNDMRILRGCEKIFVLVSFKAVSYYVCHASPSFVLIL